MHFIKSPRKSMGQNFLIDPNIIKKIIKIGNINNSKTILEIGPGYGSLTKEIIGQNPKKIIVVEKDKDLASYLKINLTSFKNIKIVNEDILNLNKKTKFGKNIIIFGNLPYNISTQILASLILVNKWPPFYEQIIFMFQKEVADRILAKCGSKNYSRLSVLSNWRLDIKKHFDISKNCFSPSPKVDSTILAFRPKKNIIINLKNPKNLEIITRELFSNRRKMINKSFKKLFGRDNSISDDLNLDLNKRPGEINNEMFYKIAKKYEELIK
jgi:16S rRNA (adenine1518-N6/adenine1519-N6)-dimethyltransferase